MKQIADNLAEEMREFFGSTIDPIDFYRACNDAVITMRSQPNEVASLKRHNSILEARLDASKMQFDDINSDLKNEINNLKKQKSVLQNKLNVANHKCSAYKSVLKDAIK
jgi:hypothetical protein